MADRDPRVDPQVGDTLFNRVTLQVVRIEPLRGVWAWQTGGKMDGGERWFPYGAWRRRTAKMTVIDRSKP